MVVTVVLVFVTTTLALGAGYLFPLFGAILDPATGDSALAVAASTLAVAALFQPARRRVQALVDRRRYDAARTVERFSGRSATTWTSATLWLRGRSWAVSELLEEFRGCRGGG